MVYSIIFIPSEKILQVASFNEDLVCSSYHNFVSSVHSDAVIFRVHSLDELFEKTKKLLILLKE